MLSAFEEEKMAGALSLQLVLVKQKTKKKTQKNYVFYYTQLKTFKMDQKIIF